MARRRVVAASERIGVQLGVGKTVRHMYRAKYISYVDDVEILFWARLARKLDRAVVRLGGEGRLAAVEAKGGRRAPRRVAEGPIRDCPPAGPDVHRQAGGQVGGGAGA